IGSLTKLCSEKCVALVFAEVSGQDVVSQYPREITEIEGQDVALNCNISRLDTVFWYRQNAGRALQYATDTNNRIKDGADFAEERFSTNVSKAERTVPLNILQVKVTDSAGYYCALSPTEAQISGSALQKLPCGVLWLSGYSTRLTSDRRWFNDLQNESMRNFPYSTH
uniref:Ig-like domain-containing protein n=1 Tax=Callorhinchus milii TaxID=7868 RepID=A0A4W3GMC9_CALMI